MLPQHTGAPPRSPRVRTSFRRRRIVWGVVLLSVTAMLLLAPRSLWESKAGQIGDPFGWGCGGGGGGGALEPALGTTNGNAPTGGDDSELGLLLHMVASSELRIPAEVDATRELPREVYIGGQEDGMSFQPAEADPPVIVFSKTYCPYSTKAKALLERYNLSPKAKIIEVDLREDAMQVKTILTRLTGQSTFPNIMINGVSIGGYEDVKRMDEAGALLGLLSNAGVSVV